MVELLGSELGQLGHDFAAEILLYLQRVDSKRVDFRSLSPFDTYGGVELFQASMGNRFVVFAVEIDDVEDLKISLMLAGQHGTPMQSGTFSWDGINYRALRTGLLNARAAAWFA